MKIKTTSCFLFKIVLMLALTFLLCLSISGCKIDSWSFEQDIDNIISIDIVNVDGDPYSLEGYNIEVIKEISDIHYQEIVNDIQNLEMWRYYGAPNNAHGKGFRITFKNGDFDLITCYDPDRCYKQEDGTYISTLCGLNFRSSAFDDLIAKWSDLE